MGLPGRLYNILMQELNQYCVSKSIRAPLPMLRIIPTGGVTPETAAAFLEAGCVALGAGASLVSKEILKTCDWPALTARAEKFVRVIREARSGVKVPPEG